ncbi:hypothetical protein [Streptococcus suis]|uniref:hypothetical protein n=1 Tax=Streptococcus suis TaxID=1307 RepID=UPI0003F86CAC|nr:hypothetical protein [Streptococcus suis]
MKDMSRKFEKVYIIVALLPVLMLISFIISGNFLWIFSTLEYLVKIKPILIFEILIFIAYIVFGVWKKSVFKKKDWMLYSSAIIGTFSIFMLGKIWVFNSLQLVNVIFLQPSILIVACILKTDLFPKIKEFFQKANQTLFWLNIFDIAYIFIWFWISQIKEMSDRLAIFWIITLLIAMPIARTFILNVYIRQNKKIKLKGQTYLLRFIEFSIISFFQLIFYSYPLINSNEFSIYMLWFPIFATVSYIFLNSLSKKIDDGPEKVVVVFLKILSFIAMAVIIIVLHLFENDFIGMLTWFLPIFIPVFIGEINTQYVQKEDKIIPEPTLKMKKHLYWLQLVSFNTLVILNLSLINIIDNKSIKVIVKEWLESSFQTTTNSNFFSTCFMLVLSFLISSVLSELLVWLLKVVYLDKTNGYFAYKKSYIKTNRKFKKNIHKRRT